MANKAATKIDRETATSHVTEHQHAYRIVGAAVCQLAAFVVVMSAPFSFVSGARLFVIGLLMVAAVALAAWEGVTLHNRVAEVPEPVKHGYRDAGK